MNPFIQSSPIICTEKSSWNIQFCIICKRPTMSRSLPDWDCTWCWLEAPDILPGVGKWLWVTSGKTWKLSHHVGKHHSGFWAKFYVKFGSKTRVLAPSDAPWWHHFWMTSYQGWYFQFGDVCWGWDFWGPGTLFLTFTGRLLLKAGTTTKESAFTDCCWFWLFPCWQL